MTIWLIIEDKRIILLVKWKYGGNVTGRIADLGEISPTC